MKFWVGTTDNEWFRFLRNRGADEVNFWQPRGAVQYNSLNPGSLFLFKLKRPHNHIAGGGYFVKSTSHPDVDGVGYFRSAEWGSRLASIFRDDPETNRERSECRPDARLYRTVKRLFLERWRLDC